MRLLSSRLSQNTAALLISNTGSALLSFLLSVLIARVLGEDGLGIYATALAWVFPLSMITEFGLGTLISRDVAQAPDDAHAYLRASVAAKLLIASVLIGVLWIVTPLLSNDILVQQGLRLSSPLIVILPFYSSFTAVFRARQIMRPIALLNLGMLLSQVLFTIIVLLNGAGIIAIFIVNTLSSCGQLIAAWMIYRAKFYQPAQKLLSALPLLKKAAPFAIAAMLAAIQARIIVILLAAFTNTAEVGYFVAAMRFIEAVGLLPHAFFDALFPSLAELAANPDKLENRFHKVLIGLVALGLVFGALLWLIAGQLIRFVYGPAFVPAIPILMVAAWALLPLLLKGGRTLYWYARGQETFVNWITGFVIAVQIVLALFLIPRFGGIGAAVVFVLVETLTFSLLILQR